MTTTSAPSRQTADARRRWSAGLLFLLFLWVFGSGVTQAIADSRTPVAHALGDRSEQWGVGRHMALAPASAPRAQAKAQPSDGAGDPALPLPVSAPYLAELSPSPALPRHAWWPADEAGQRFSARAPPLLM